MVRRFSAASTLARKSRLRQRGGRGPYDDVRTGSRDLHACACAGGSRASLNADGYWAGRCACSTYSLHSRMHGSQVDLRVVRRDPPVLEQLSCSVNWHRSPTHKVRVGPSWTCGTGRHRIRPANGTFWRRAGSTRAPASQACRTVPRHRDPRFSQVLTQNLPPTRRVWASNHVPAVDPQAVDLLVSGPSRRLGIRTPHRHPRPPLWTRPGAVSSRGGGNKYAKGDRPAAGGPGAVPGISSDRTTCGQRCGRRCLVARSRRPQPHRAPPARAQCSRSQTTVPDQHEPSTRERDAAWIQDITQVHRRPVTALATAAATTSAPGGRG